MREQGDPADHRPVHPAFPSIGIKKLIVADRAQIHRRNRGCRHTLPFHLPTDQGLEIQPSLMSSIVTHNRLPIRQSHSELVEHRIVHFIAAGTGRGSNTDSQIRPHRPESARHQREGLRNNPGHSASPTGMNRRDDTPAWVMHEHGDTIRRAHRHRHAGLIGHQRVPPAGETDPIR